MKIVIAVIISLLILGTIDEEEEKKKKKEENPFYDINKIEKKSQLTQIFECLIRGIKVSLKFGLVIVILLIIVSGISSIIKLL